MATVQTVLGPIDASRLGVTRSHEQVLVGMGEDTRHHPWLFDWEATRANVVRELREAKAGGVDTIIAPLTSWPSLPPPDIAVYGQLGGVQ